MIKPIDYPSPKPKKTISLKDFVTLINRTNQIKNNLEKNPIKDIFEKNDKN